MVEITDFDKEVVIGILIRDRNLDRETSESLIDTDKEKYVWVKGTYYQIAKFYYFMYCYGLNSNKRVQDAYRQL